ncbi:hypothetical protein [Sphaerotilus sp.]|uniref:hypothetical protein n=1 Tax=Sphaerotilus sp. TaxID=2093942 RepID=UPI00286E5F56|nr:hypothetical protein [Sphaerotilus sp.]
MPCLDATIPAFSLAFTFAMGFALPDPAAAQAAWTVELAPGLASDAEAGRSAGGRVSAGVMWSLGAAGASAGVVLGAASFGDTRTGPWVQRHRRHTSGPFAALQAAVPLAEGWQAQARIGLGRWQTALVTSVNGAEVFESSEPHIGLLLGAGLTCRLPMGLGVVAAVDVGQHRFDGLPTVRPVLWSLGLSATF